MAVKLGADLEKIIDKKNRKGIFGWLGAGRDGMKKKLTEIGPLTKNPADYDLVILGSPVWGWAMVPAVRTYIEQKKANFKSVALFTTSDSTPIDKLIITFEEATGRKMITSVGFNTIELKDKTIYDKKLTVFVEAVR